MAKLKFQLLLPLLLVSCLAQSENLAQKLKQESEKDESVPYSSPNIKSSNIYFAEHFDNHQEFKKKWVLSKAKKPDVSEDLAQYDGKWDLLPLEKFPLKKDLGLVLVTESRHAAIVAKFNKPFVFDDKKKFIAQYVVTFQKNVDCGGAYMKLITENALRDLSAFNDKTPYTIMFGPDKCGGVAKMHFIIRHKNPTNGTITEKHCTKLKVDDAMYKDQEPYLLKLVIEGGSEFSFYINNELQYRGGLLHDDTFNPPINPPKEIIDDTDSKPEDWDDRPKIPEPGAEKPDDWNEDEPSEIVDPNAFKPEGWLDDEPLTIPDETAVKPSDWENEMDGEWEPPVIENPTCKEAPGCGPWTPPVIENPKFKGKWKPPMVENPDYKGKWIPKKIPNPDYFYDDAPLKSSPIGYIGFELWSLVNNMYFDDILITDSEAVSDEWTEKTWILKKKSIAAESVTLKGRVMKQLNYKPGWWVIYALYCAIPITLYILYMRDVIRKASFYKVFLEYTNNYPWLWAVYVLILAIIVGVIGTCCLRMRRNKDDFEREILHKKTDEFQPDDEVRGKIESPMQSSSNVEVPENNTASADGYEEEDTDPEEKQSKPSSDEEEEEPVPTKGKKNAVKQDQEREETENQTAAVTSSPRKRRPRRD